MEPHPAQTPDHGNSGKSGNRPNNRKRLSPRGRKLAAALGVVVLLIIVRLVYSHFTYEETDDAQVQAHSLMLSARVGGFVSEVLVEENEKVKTGQVLARIDSRDYENALKIAQSNVESATARLHDADTNFKRISELYRKGAAPRAQFDSAQARYLEESKKLAAAQSQQDQAQLNVSYAEIKAPTNGRIARRSVEPGMVVSSGQPLFGFVDSGDRWIAANFKETQLKGIHPGNQAEVSVDAIGGHSFQGVVESLSPSTGAVFSLLPPDNATGNFTKVVQRVPVRIKLVNLTDSDIDELRTGLSADVSVRIR